MFTREVVGRRTKGLHPDKAEHIMFDQASRANSALQIGTRLLCSDTVGWTSALLEVWKHPAQIDAYSSVATSDQTLIFTAQGRYELECFSQGVWKTTCKRPGMTGATAPMHVSQLRLRSLDATPIITFQIYLPSEFLQEAGEEYRRAGRSFGTAPLQFPSMQDPFLFATARALVQGMELDAPDLYCNSACRTLATHLLLLNGRVKEADVRRSIGRDLTDRRLARVLDYMHEHSTQVISLDALSKEAGVSRFHFTRLFKQKLGISPHEYLVDLRLRRAADRLRTTDLDVATIASECGYSNAGRFASAFRGRYRLNPSEYRRADSGSS